jgi:hypothetical protein
MSQATIHSEGDDCLPAARERVKEGSQQLWPVFCKCDTSCTLDESIQRVIFNALVDKTMHARHGMEINIYKNENTKYKGSKNVGASLRSGLRSKTSN